MCHTYELLVNMARTHKTWGSTVEASSVMLLTGGIGINLLRYGSTGLPFGFRGNHPVAHFMARTLKTYSLEAVEAAATKLEEFAQKGPRVLSVRMAIERLRPQIEALIAKGFSTDAIVMALRDSGISVPGSAFNEHWKAVTLATAQPPSKRPRKATKSPVQTAAEPAAAVPLLSPASARGRENV